MKDSITELIRAQEKSTTMILGKDGIKLKSSLFKISLELLGFIAYLIEIKYFEMLCVVWLLVNQSAIFIVILFAGSVQTIEYRNILLESPEIFL